MRSLKWNECALSVECAVDRTSGRQLWSSTTPVYYPCYPIDGPDGSVYFTDSDGNLTKLSTADGKRIWTCSTGERISGPPAIVGNSLYLGAGIGHVLRVMQQSGGVESDFNTSTLADRLSLTNRLVSACTNRPILDSANNVYISTTYGWLFRLSPAR
jgi:outer membrane protein assembly factor BamB